MSGCVNTRVVLRPRVLFFRFFCSLNVACDTCWFGLSAILSLFSLTMKHTSDVVIAHKRMWIVSGRPRKKYVVRT